MLARGLVRTGGKLMAGGPPPTTRLSRQRETFLCQVCWQTRIPLPGRAKGTLMSAGELCHRFGASWLGDAWWTTTRAPSGAAEAGPDLHPFASQSILPSLQT